jgi:hypothetical protein
MRDQVIDMRMVAAAHGHFLAVGKKNGEIA